MLKHEDTSQTQPPLAAHVRVTPEELAAAVTALQIRKEGQPGTIAIGDAVEELGLDVTPEEVLAEVQARRQTAKPERKRDYRALACAGACFLLPVIVGGISQATQHPMPSGMPSPNSSQTEVFSGVGNEQQVYVSTHGLKQIIEGTSEAKVQVYTGNKGIRWGLIKHDGKVYVQAYTLQVSEKTLMSKPSIFVNSEDHYGPDAVGFDEGGTLYAAEKVNLPIKSLHVDDSEQTAKHAQITVSGLHTDNHLWDGFQDRFGQ